MNKDYKDNYTNWKNWKAKDFGLLSNIEESYFNKELKKTNLPEELRVGAILRDKDIIIPRSNFIFQKKDIVVFLAKRDHVSVVENMFRISSI